MGLESGFCICKVKVLDLVKFSEVLELIKCGNEVIEWDVRSCIGIYLEGFFGL